MKDLHTEELREALGPVLLEQLDPRVHPATKPFLDHIRAESAAEIAAFFCSFNEMVLEMAFDLRVTLERFSKSVEDQHQSLSGDIFDSAQSLLRSLHPEILVGWDRVEPILGALRAFDDEGFYTLLVSHPTMLAAEIVLDDDSFEVLIQRHLMEPAGA
jgi:hypothetical protein